MYLRWIVKIIVISEMKKSNREKLKEPSVICILHSIALLLLYYLTLFLLFGNKYKILVKDENGKEKLIKV